MDTATRPQGLIDCKGTRGDRRKSRRPTPPLSTHASGRTNGEHAKEEYTCLQAELPKPSAGTGRGRWEHTGVVSATRRSLEGGDDQ